MQSLQEVISHHFFFFFFCAELAQRCIIPHESSCQGDADLQRLRSLLTDGNLSLKLCQSPWLLHLLPCILRLSCHTLLSASSTLPRQVRLSDLVDKIPRKSLVCLVSAAIIQQS